MAKLVSKRITTTVTEEMELVPAMIECTARCLTLRRSNSSRVLSNLSRSSLIPNPRPEF